MLHSSSTRISQFGTSQRSPANCAMSARRKWLSTERLKSTAMSTWHLIVQLSERMQPTSCFGRFKLAGWVIWSRPGRATRQNRQSLLPPSSTVCISAITMVRVSALPHAAPTCGAFFTGPPVTTCTILGITHSAISPILVFLSTQFRAVSTFCEDRFDCYIQYAEDNCITIRIWFIFT